MLTITPQEGGAVARLLLDGELDLSTAGDLASAVEESLADRTLERIVVDLHGVRFCDSSGIEALLVAQDLAASAGLPLVTEETSDVITRILKVCGVWEVLTGTQPAL
ncbi:STAS domain-containing protein [Hamadaea tsunoensis]|uniref:STAS domain-containing protein n=1 Tax=Hamadaea tsunoensis TaxID=53368 RepID=UPI0004191681|nr:STAS domain-containing protein [Hamadaea tsunoensis]